jgi:hypothetical protein
VRRLLWLGKQANNDEESVEWVPKPEYKFAASITANLSQLKVATLFGHYLLLTPNQL